MSIGVFNPSDTARSTASRPADVLNGEGVRRWFSDALLTILKAQDLNRLIAQFYSAGDYYGIADAEGDDNYLRSTIQAVVDNAEWSQSGGTGTMDISAKRGLKGQTQSIPAAGLTSFGTVQANKIALINYNASPRRAIVPGATIVTPNGAPICLTQNDSFLVIGAADGSVYRVYPLPANNIRKQANPIATNGDMEQWPEGTSFSPAGSTVTQLAFGWKGRRTTNTNWTFSRQTGFSLGRYCGRMQRTAGDTATTAIVLSYQIPSSILQAMAGKAGIISFDLRCGATMVTALGAGATLTTEYREGLGFDEVPNLSTGVFPTALAGTSATTFLGGYTPSTTAIRVYCLWISDATATEGHFRIIFTPIATAAGASEYFEFTNFSIDVGPYSYQFENEPLAIAEGRMLPSARKSFARGTAPAQNVGVGTGIRAACTKAGAVSQFIKHVEFETEMRAVPTVTLYNPAAANGQVRNITGSTDSTLAAVSNVTTKGFDVTCTGAAGWAVGDILEFHYFADARL